MATEVPQTLEYRVGQLNDAPILEVENFTNWKNRFMCQIIGIEPQFENIIKNDPYIPMTTGQRKPEVKWTPDERKAANLDQRLKSLILSVLLDDHMNSDFQNSPDGEEYTRSSQEYLNDLKEEYQARALLAKSKRFFKKGTQSPSQHKTELRPTKDFEAKYNKVKAKLAHLSSSALASKAATMKNKGLIEKAYEWDKEEVSSNDNEMVKVKVFMALAKIMMLSAKSIQKCECVKISMKKGIASFVNFCDEKGITQNFSSPYTPEQNGVAERKNRTLIEAARTMLSGSVFSKQYWTEAVATACYTQNKSTIVKRHLKSPYEIFRKRIPNINFLHVFGCPVYIHNHEDHLEKFGEKADDGYLLGHSLISKAFRVFNIRRQQIKETYHITFNESPNAIKFLKPLVDDINIAETKRYPLDEYLHPYEPSQRYQTNNNNVIFIEPYECPEPVVLETESEHSNHTKDEHIINNIPSTEYIQISKNLSSPSVEDTSVQNTIPSLNPSISIPSMITLAPQDRWSQDKHIEQVNIIGDPGAGMLTRAMAKELSTASAHECLFVDFLPEEEPKKVSEAL
ncbi:retrovirus-related pol polyprotein from transposon TNT 1-94 [Tanacetum coccineum]